VKEKSRLHGIIIKGGEAANIVPAYSKALFLVRAEDEEYLQELKDLREKQFKEKTGPARLNAKFSPGGLVDLEYSVQILQLTYGKEVPSLRTPLLREALEALSEQGVLSDEESARLINAYTFLRRLINSMRMLRAPPWTFSSRLRILRNLLILRAAWDTREAYLNFVEQEGYGIVNVDIHNRVDLVKYALRKGIIFTDGTPFNADAAKYNIDNGINSTMWPNMKKVKECVIVDPYTIRLDFVNGKWDWTAVKALAGFWSVMMFSPTALKNNTPEWKMTHVVGTGPFILKEYVRDQRLTYDRNDNYWKRRAVS
jgi:hypothetical protein